MIGHWGSKSSKETLKSRKERTSRIINDPARRIERESKKKKSKSS